MIAKSAAAESHYSQNTKPSRPALVRGSGALVVDVHGSEYIDCCSQTLNLNMGQCHPEIEQAVIEQLKKLTFASSRFSCDVATRLVEKLVEITPSLLTKVNIRNTSGSSANECAVKLARRKTGKQTVFALMHSHHGQTFEMMRISGKHFKNPYLGERRASFLPLPECSRCPFGKERDTCRTDCLDDLDDLYDLHFQDVAAVIVEPVLVDAGVIAPPKKYFQRLRDFCTRYQIALIFDEVQTGFGWLGTMHGMDYLGVTPDIVSFGKGIGAGYPLAATMMSDDYDVLGYGEHEITYGAHPLACAASLKMIEILERPSFQAELREKSRLIESGLGEIASEFDIVTEVRGTGFIWGIEVTDGGPSRSVAPVDLVAELLKEGVIIRTSKVGVHSNVLQFKPPLVITKDQLERAFEGIRRVLRRVGPGVAEKAA